MSNIEELANTPDVKLIDTNIDNLLARAYQTYEEEYKSITGEKITIMPATEERVILNTMAYMIMLGLIATDQEFKNGTLKGATGDALDALGMTRGGVERPKDEYATVSIKYTFDGPLTVQQTIPKGNRVSCGDVYFATTEEQTVAIGTTDITMVLKCTQAGTIGNDFAVGKINTHSDPLAWVKSVENVDISQGGANPDDDDYTRIIFNTPEGYAVAGPTEAYITKTKEYSLSVQDVCVRTPEDIMELEYKFDDSSNIEQTEEPEIDLKNGTIAITDTNIANYTMDLSGVDLELQFVEPVKSIRFKLTRGGIVEIYPLLENSMIPTQTFLDGLKTALSAYSERPLTDKVETKAPTEKNYEINVDYYIDVKNSSQETTIQSQVQLAFEEYKNWQRATLGRDINPDELIKLVKNAGAKRLTITSPTYTTVSENEVAKCSATVITYRGLE